MVEVKNKALEEVFERYKKIDGRKILENLRKF